MSGVSAERVETLVALLTTLASGDLSARGEMSPAEDEIDAVVQGVNLLAEELEASRAELEQRVTERTAELEQANRAILRLGELGNLLQACETPEEAYTVTSEGLTSMFDGFGGAMYMYRASRNVLELKLSWGGLHSAATMLPTACWALRRGQAHVVEAAAPSLSCQHVEARTGTSVCLPMSAHGDTIGLLHLMDHRLVDVRQKTLGPGTRQLAHAAAEQTSLAMANLSLREKLQRQALRDPLTGLHNRRFVDEWLATELAQTERSGRLLGVIMADVDHFKQVNDVHGHEVGDELLKAIGDVFRRSLRTGDMPCRYGGEEFLILVSDVDQETLTRRAETLREGVAGIRAHHRGLLLPAVTMSAGTAVYPQDGASAEDVVKAADSALYSAKHAGRNRVVAAS